MAMAFGFAYSRSFVERRIVGTAIKVLPNLVSYIGLRWTLENRAVGWAKQRAAHQSRTIPTGHKCAS